MPIYPIPGLSLYDNMPQLRAKKSLGQHFLIDPKFHERIVGALKIQVNDVVVEIGPGTGLLTRELLKSPLERLIAFELDDRAIPILKESFKSEGERFEVREQDFLLTDLGELSRSIGQTLRIAGNIPYYITSPILFKLIDDREYIQDAILLVQLEVAERLTARSHTKAYGIPTVLANFFGEVKYLFRVPAGAFRPVPKVDSAVVYIDFRRDYFTRSPIDPPSNFDNSFFRMLVRTLFAMRRKTIRNNLKALISTEKLAAIEQSPHAHYLNARAEELSIQDFLVLMELITA